MKLDDINLETRKEKEGQEVGKVITKAGFGLSYLTHFFAATKTL